MPRSRQPAWSTPIRRLPIRQMRMLALAVAVIVAGGIGLTGWMLADARAAAWNNAAQSAQNLISVFENDIKRNVDLFDLSLQAVIAGLRIDGFPTLSPAVRQQVLFDGSIKAQFLGAVLVTDEHGNVVVDSQSPVPRAANYADADFLLVHRERRDVGLYVSAPFRGRTSGQWSIALSRRLEHADGSFAGVVVGSVRLDFFRALFDTVKVAPDSRILVARTDKTLLVRKPYAERDIGRDMSSTALFRHLADVDRGVFMNTPKSDGVPRLYAYRKVGGLPLVLALAIPTQQVFADWRQKAVIVGMVTLGLIGTAGALAGLLFGELMRRGLAERAALDSQREYRLLADHATDVILRNGPDGERRYISPACRTLYGYEPEELVGTNSFDFVHPDDAGTLKAAFRGMLQDGASTSVIVRMRRKDARYIWVEANMRLAVDADSGEREVVTVVRDVTAHKADETEMRAARQAAEAAVRAQARFLAMMSHEIRTPMTGIIGFTELVLAGALDDDQRQRLTHVREAGRGLLAILNDVLDFSKVEAGKLTLEAKPLSLRDLVDACRAIILPLAAEKGLQVAVTRATDLPDRVIGDAGRIRQVLLNLLNNAVKFTPAGRIALDLAQEPDGRVRFAVSDTGVGIAADQLPRLFKEFSQLENQSGARAGGTGLGLAICRRLVTMMGGEIGVDSQPGTGSRFWFTLDLPVASADRPDAGPPALEPLPGPTARILVVDDVAMNRELACAILERAGHKVAVVEDGQAALDALEDGGDFDLVLMDVHMPGLDGLGATARIRAAGKPWSAVPILAMTAGAMEVELDQCRIAGMNGHVAKPFEPATLLATVLQFQHVPAPGGEAL